MEQMEQMEAQLAIAIACQRPLEADLAPIESTARGTIGVAGIWCQRASTACQILGVGGVALATGAALIPGLFTPPVLLLAAGFASAPAWIPVR